MSTIVPLSHFADSGSGSGGVPSSIGCVCRVTSVSRGIPKVISTYSPADRSLCLENVGCGNGDAHKGQPTHRTGRLLQSLHHNLIPSCVYVLVVNLAHEVSAGRGFRQTQSQGGITHNGRNIAFQGHESVADEITLVLAGFSSA